MASISFGNAVRLFGRGRMCPLSPRLTSSAFSRPESTLRRGFASARQQNVLGLSSNPRRVLLQPTHGLPGLVFTRHHSKSSPIPGEAAVVEVVPTGAETASIPAQEATSSLSDAVSGAGDTVTSSLDTIHTSLQYGDLAALGLAGWSPAGLAQWSMEIINTTTHLPWFWTIVAGTAFWRIIVAPTTVLGLRNTSRLQPYQSQVQKVQAEMNNAAKKNDLIERQRVALKLKAIYDKAGVSMATGFLAPLVQIPVTLGLFFGVKWMCNLPVEQMKWSGLAMLPDLTIPDPTWVLPLLVTALVNVQISIGKGEMDLKTRPAMGHLMNGLRVLSVISIAVTASLPAGLLVSLITTSALTIIQSTALQYKPLRRRLGILDQPEKSDLPSMKESWEYVIKGFQNKMAEAKTSEVRKIQRARASEQMKRVEEARRR